MAKDSIMTKKRILLVEDEPEISNAVAFRLRRRGFEVETADEGQVGLEKALTIKPNVVILDLFLPGLAGEEICKGIREHEDPKIKNIPVIMLTAKTMIADKIIGKVVGADVYLTKPFDMDKLLGTIEQLLEGKKPDQGSEFYKT